MTQRAIAFAAYHAGFIAGLAFGGGLSMIVTNVSTDGRVGDFYAALFLLIAGGVVFPGVIRRLLWERYGRHDDKA